MNRFNPCLPLLVVVTLCASPVAADDVITAVNPTPPKPAPKVRTDWGIELGLGIGVNKRSDYTRTLERFGYHRERQGRGRFSVAAERRVHPNIGLVLQLNNLDHQVFERPSGIGPDDEFRWSAWAPGLHARFSLPLKDPNIRLYLQVGGGPTIVRSVLHQRTRDNIDQTSFVERDLGFHVTGLLGAEFMFGRVAGLFLQGGYVYARGFNNRLGDNHLSGGGVGIVGVRFDVGRRQ